MQLKFAVDSRVTNARLLIQWSDLVAANRKTKRSSNTTSRRIGQSTQLLEDLANMQDDGISHFRNKWKVSRKYKNDDLLKLRDELATLWCEQCRQPGEERTVYRRAFSGLKNFLQHDSNVSGGGLQRVICQGWLRREQSPWIVRWSDEEKQIFAKNTCLPALLALGCIRVAGRMRFCRNKECLSPFFMGKRKDQRYCSDICAAPAKREAKRKWWKENRGKVDKRAR